MKNTTAISLILISVGIFYTFISPQYEKVKAQRAEAAQYEEVLDTATTIVATRDTLMEKYRTIPAEDLLKLKKLLPDNIDTVRLAVDLDAIAARYGISLEKVGVSTEGEDDTSTAIIDEDNGAAYAKVRVNFSFTSDYTSFRQFLEDIEKSLRLTDVRATIFTTDTTGLNEYNIDIETYWLK